MKLFLIAIAATLMVAGTVAADDLLNSHAEATIEGVDPAVDGTHTVDVVVSEGADGTPTASVLVDGAPVLP